MAQQDKSWENSWQSAFEGKSVTPPAGAWENIEKELERKKSARIIPIWWSAAAAVALLIISFVIADNNFIGDLSSEQVVSSQEEKNTTVQDKKEFTDNNLNEKQQQMSALSYDNEVEKEEELSEVYGPLAGDKGNSQEITGGAPGLDDNQPFVANKENRNQREALTAIEEAKGMGLYREPIEVGLIASLPAVVFDHELSEIPELWGVPVYFNSKKSGMDEWYAGVDFSRGSAGSDYGFSSSGDGLEFSNIPDSQSGNNYYTSDTETGSTVTYGISVGKKIAKRIVLESGLNYRRIETSTVSNVAYDQGGARSVYNESTSYAGAGQLTMTSFYEMENVHQFISIPLKAGYLILDKKWKMSVNTGLAGDYFFKTSTHDTSGNFESYETTPSESVYWNSLNLSVLGEVNITRQIGEHYIISVSPQLRQALSDFSNSERQELRPAIVQLGMQLQYKF
ncbi:MAG: hypothetical protein ACNS60_17930 [Candidatus Cyclobacteriaceae bacterium M2_1C_046]